MRFFLLLIVAMFFQMPTEAFNRYFNEDLLLLRDMGIKYQKNVVKKDEKGEVIKVSYDESSSTLKIAPFKKFTSHREYTHLILQEMAKITLKDNRIEEEFSQDSVVKELASHRTVQVLSKNFEVKSFNNIKINMMLREKFGKDLIVSEKQDKESRIIAEKAFVFIESELEKRGVKLDQSQGGDLLPNLTLILFGVPIKTYSE